MNFNTSLRSLIPICLTLFWKLTYLIFRDNNLVFVTRKKSQIICSVLSKFKSREITLFSYFSLTIVETMQLNLDQIRKKKNVVS